jgi:hypothetical protein
MNDLFAYLQKISLPNAPIAGEGTISNQFLSLGIHNLYDAIHYIHQLPYSRISKKSDPSLVLTEKCGTCSPKHALIATLAKELNIELVLCTGILIMNAKNMPAIAGILKEYALNGIPEAHVYLKYNHQKLDVTFPNQNIFKSYGYVKEMNITPEQITNFKDEWHRQAIEEWIKTEKLTYQLDEIWKIRELCINALS